MVEAERTSESFEFKWGQMKRRGGKKKDVQFYGSFSYDGVEYFLYDSVYLYKDSEQEPYIGKLIKIWEGGDKRKKVKVLWFFRPREISCFLEVEEASENELFLASGDGPGLCNINPLEAIAGKCNVVCISEDSRNVRPTDEELQMADYVFRRTFDVGTCKVMDKMDDEIAGIDVKLLINKMDAKKEDPESKKKFYPTASGLCVTSGDLSKKLKRDEETVVLSDGKMLKAHANQSQNEDCKSDGQDLEVAPRPEADRRKWFKGLVPWDDQLRTAYEQGTLVLLHNLDPTYTKEEVKDIVWHGFKESCTTMIIQRTMVSSPYSGQAFAIFKKKGIAEMVVRKLDEGCLLLSNGRPLLGRLETHCFVERKSTFYGHLVIDKLRYRMAREKRDAVSTSHCSQPNTFEYDMAIEWILLQERSDFLWKKLYQEQEEELGKLKRKFKARIH